MLTAIIVLALLVLAYYLSMVFFSFRRDGDYDENTDLNLKDKK